MSELELKIKLAYISGLSEVVHKELEQKGFKITNEAEDTVFVEYSESTFVEAKKLRSVARAYLVIQGIKLNPLYISNHKSILGDIIDTILKNNTGGFKSFKLTCAGSGTEEAQSLVQYIKERYKLTEGDEVDLKIHIIKNDEVWEVGAQITPRPLSVRKYRVENMSGAMDPTIAYAVDSLARIEQAKSVLNIFSGSGTLLIEALECYENLERVVGFDNNKNHLSLSIQNIKSAGLMDRVSLKEADIFSRPDLGKFDVVVSDLPFGMSISKGEDLEELYKNFVEYSEGVLNEGGRLVAYTSEVDILEKCLKKSNFKMTKTIELKFITSVNAYLRPKIFVCE